MSQITRCPACATTFKVVADQLRISEGWVRCGQCKEVFDASANLLPDDVSGLQQSVGSSSPAENPSVRPVSSSSVRPSAQAPVRSSAKLGSSNVSSGASGGDKVLSVPAPAVPAFLAAAPLAEQHAATEPAPLQMPTTFAWPAPVAPLAAKTDTNTPTNLPHTPENLPAAPSDVAAVVKAVVQHSGQGLSETASAAALAKAASPRGYELPFPPLHDWDDAVSAEAAVLPALAVQPYPDLDASAFVSAVPAAALPASIATAAPTIEQSELVAPDSVPFVDPAAERALVSEPLPTLAFPESAPQVIVRPAVSLPSMPRTPGLDVDDEDFHEDEHLTADELSFVRTARRQAFWRKPLVRVLLGLGLFTLAVALVLQVGLHQRDRLAAINPKARATLQWVCELLQCELAPVRQIADLVIDSSSFNKGRGDVYQLGLTIKNRAGIALAMPAVELTLTDVQDQPVLRRVLYPGDLAAPPELAAQAEWSATIPMSVASNGYRITGYRLVAFYP